MVMNRLEFLALHIVKILLILYYNNIKFKLSFKKLQHQIDI